jgi:hypothetical protein
MNYEIYQKTEAITTRFFANFNFLCLINRSKSIELDELIYKNCEIRLGKKNRFSIDYYITLLNKSGWTQNSELISSKISIAYISEYLSNTIKVCKF